MQTEAALPDQGSSSWQPDRATICVLASLARGRTLKEASADCHVSERSARRRINEAKEQWQVDSVVAVVVRAVRLGLV